MAKKQPSNVLKFSNVEGTWSCGDETAYNDVKLTRVDGPHGISAIVFVCNIQIDLDGAPQAYGPPSSNSLDNLGNAKSDSGHWVGVVSMTRASVAWLHSPLSQRVPKNRPHELDIQYLHKLDQDVAIDDSPSLKDTRNEHDYYPVKQKPGLNAGFYVSQTSRFVDGTLPEWEQGRYLDASAVAYGVITGGLQGQKLKKGDKGATLRIDKGLQSIYSILDKGPSGNKVGECSYKVFTDVGGTQLRKGKFANDFPVCHILLLKSGDKEFKDGMATLATAKNAEDLPRLIAYQLDAAKHRSGRDQLMRYKRASDIERLKMAESPTFGLTISALRRVGYHYLDVGDFDASWSRMG